MRTPPPVLPSRKDEPEPSQSWLARHGADTGNTLRVIGPLMLIFVFSLGIGMGIAELRHLTGIKAVLVALVTALVLTAAAAKIILGMSNSAGAGVLALVMPSGNSVRYEEQFSFQEAMAARGDIAGALESYEAVIAERPAAVLPRMRAAELYAKRGRDARRAAELFRSIRDAAEASPSEVLYASNRLVDLYDGALDEPGKALVELRRIVERFPGTPAAERARAALPAMKSRIMENRREG